MVVDQGIRASYIEANAGTNMCSLNDFNLQTYDIIPNELMGFLVRNPTNGALRIGPDGQPFIAWEVFRKTLLNLSMDVLERFGFPKGSFWLVQFIDKEDERVVSNSFNTEKPSKALVDKAFDELDFGMSEGGEHAQGTFVRIIVGNPGTGAGGSIPSHLKSKRCIWSHKEDGFCAPASLIICASTAAERLCYKRSEKKFNAKIQELVDCAECPDESWGFDDLDEAGECMEAQICVLDAYALTLIYETETECATKYYLLLDQQNQHFMACTDITKLSTEKKWCGLCKKLIKRQNFKTHQCTDNDCWACHKVFATPSEREAHFNTDEWSECDKCGRNMPSHCIEGHICTGSYKKCGVCGENFFDKALSTHFAAITVEEHKAVCGLKHKHCTICKEHLPTDHRCTITRTNEQYDHDKDTRKLWVFDIESARAADGTQLPTFVSAREVLKSEEGEDQTTYTERLYDSLMTTEPLSFTTLESFCEWSILQKNTDFIAHNLRGYDGVLIHSYMRYTLKIKTTPVLAGLKVMTFKFGSNRMLDSLNHVASSLAGLPKLMGLKIKGIEKDHFPHSINTFDNLGYSGPLPPFEAYEPDEQSGSVEELKKWHDEESAKYNDDNPWVLKEVVAKYCHQDTLVLAMAMGEYRRLFIDMTELDPLKSITIAAYCLKVYRSKHIPEEGIKTLSEVESTFARRALKGGRTEVFKTYAKGPLGYDDVVSLYPSRQYFETMPCGVPTIHKGEIPDDWLNGCGFAEVDITPCRTVPGVREEDFVPVLGGYSDDGKLRFDVTAKFNQVYTLPELRKAVEIGYVVDKVHEVHLYDGSDELFKTYVSTFLKVKVENSKPPKDVDATIAKQKAAFGFTLDRETLMAPENKGMRSLSKLALNNLWGKLGQRELPATELCDKVAYFKLMARSQRKEIELTNICVDKDLPDHVSVSYTEKTRKGDMVRLKAHVGIAAYVTGTARIKLYERIGDPRLAGRVCYCDTDSLVYIKDPNGYQPEQGTSLGEWESEGDDFNEFVALAPKVYSIRGPSKSIVKTKGFRMTNKAKGLITFESLQSCLEEDKSITIDYANYFKRTKHAIKVVPMSKTLNYKPEGAKRRVIEGTHDMAPWA